MLYFAVPSEASEYRGLVLFNGLAVPGATVTAVNGEARLLTITDQSGRFTFPDLTDGLWKIKIEMRGFASIDARVAITPGSPSGQWELTMLPLDRLLAMSTETHSAAPEAELNAPSQGKPEAQQGNDTSAENPKLDMPSIDQSDDGFLVNGTVNNAATSQFSLNQAFGNRRPGSGGLFNGGFAAIFDNSALDARPYSISGLASPKASYDRITVAATVGGPLRIPRVMERGPIVLFAYEGTRDHDAATEAGLVPTEAERNGDLSGLLNAFDAPVVIYNPTTGLPFSMHVIPVSPQAKALLRLYPQPNISDREPYNYQIPVLNSTHRDGVQLRLDKTLGRKDQVYGRFNLQAAQQGSTNLFSFVDSTDTLGINSTINWSRRFNSYLSVSASYNFGRLRTRIRPEFEDRKNISGEAGVAGNDQDSADWGPPTLNFSSGFAALSDAESAFNRNRSDGLSLSVGIYRRRHYVAVGGDFGKEEYNEFFQKDPRGTFTFTGAATAGPAQDLASAGSDLADFLLGIPDTSSIAFGNADKYLRQSVYDLYLADDWRLKPGLTIDAGARWEYGAPITELYGRLVNLDASPGFTAVVPVLGNNPIGQLTGQHFPASLVRSDRSGIEPRVGVSWRPIPASALVIRAGYGIYHDTSVYLNPALEMAQQTPLSKSLSVQNSAVCPLTLAHGFTSCPGITPDIFAIDPNFRVGYAQTWSLGLQNDLPGALQANLTYLGVKGTHGVQEFLPNTYPIGAVNPCSSCPSGFAYRISGGNSTRESGQVQLRRRLRSGFTATALYTWSKSLDDDAFLGGRGYLSIAQQNQNPMEVAPPGATAIAQNWRNLRAERALSTFDQRNLLNLIGQYTTGEGLRGGDLTNGWSGRLLKEWTMTGRITAGSGLPETPIYLAAVPGAGYTGTIRPDRTGARIYQTARVHLNKAAFAPPVVGQWGTARRNSIIGPLQFTLNWSLARTFRLGGKFSLDARVDAANLLNRPEFTSWNTTVNSAQFGLPVAVNAMRSLQTTVRLRF